MDEWTKRRARDLRKAMPKAEAALWNLLRRRSTGCHFRRQHPVGPYFLDFACLEHRVGVECDGDYHDRHGRDRTRDRFIEKQGFVVMRFWNSEVLYETTSVVNTIAFHAHPQFDRDSWSVTGRYILGERPPRRSEAIRPPGVPRLRG